MRKIKFIILLYPLIAALSMNAHARQDVKVGGYEFQPFVDIDRNMKARGLTLELIDPLNQHQKQYRFTFVPTTARRRYQDFEAQNFDMLFFENPNWE
jgi:hypothetical protein